MVQIKDILHFFENDIYDIKRQASWDNSGAQVIVDKDTHITGIITCLDITADVIQQALLNKCNLIISHHPLIFKPLKSLINNKGVSNIIIDAIKNNINIVSYHTNIDVSIKGTNNYLLELLGAQDEGILDITGKDSFVKLVVYVPLSHSQEVLTELTSAGAGLLGNYSHCSFSLKGTGRFKPNEDSNPFIGQKGLISEVEEEKHELLVESSKLSHIIAVLEKAHPYEEPAYDIFDVHHNIPFGYGKVGLLKEKTYLSEFITKIKDILSIKTLSINTDNLDMKFSRFAICTGSGADMWRSCLKKGIDVLLTGDLKHHDALDARHNGIIIIDAGHFNTEKIYMNNLSKVIQSKFNIKTYNAFEENTIFYV